MMDEEKTRDALIAELREARKEIQRLRAQAALLESRVMERTRPPHHRRPRQEIETDIEFISDFDLVRAKGVDLSEGGICFEVDRDLPFEMKFDLEGNRHEKRANLIWMRGLDDGRNRLGFAFVPPKTFPEF